MPIVQVKNKETGAIESVDLGDYQSNTDLYQLVEGQSVLVKPIEGSASSVTLEEQLRAPAFEQLTPEEELQLTKKNVEEARFGGVGQTIRQGIRGFVSGATLEGSEYFLRSGDDPFEKEDEEAKRRIHEGVFKGAELVGELGTAFAGGGAGTLAKLARFTPSGLLAKGGTALARSGVSTAGKIGYGAAGGAFEAATSAGVRNIVEQSLQDKPFSGEALASTFFGAGLLGAGAGGLLTGTGLLAKRSMGGILDNLTRGADDPALRKIADDDLLTQVTRAADGAADGATGKAIPWKNLFDDADLAKGNISASAADVVRAIDKVGVNVSKAKKIGSDLFSDASLADAATRGVSKEVLDTLHLRYRGALDDFYDAGRSAKKWQKEFIESAGGPKALAKGNIPSLKNNPNVSIETLSRLDETALRLDNIISESQGLIQPGRVLTQAAEQGSATGIRGLVQQAKEKVSKSTIGSKVGGVAGVAELTSEYHGIAPSRILRGVPVLGEASSIYLKYRGMRSALGRIGLVPRTATTQAASKSVGVSNRIARSVKKFATGERMARVGDFARSAVSRKSPDLLKLAQDLTGQTPQEAGDKVRQELFGAPEFLVESAALTAERAHAYLQENAPVDPLEDSPWAGQGVNPEQTKEFGFRVDMVANPGHSIEQIFTGEHPRPFVAIDALQSVYFELFAKIQADLIADIDKLVDSVKEPQRQRIGSLFGVPLTRSLASGALRPPIPSSQMPQAQEILGGGGQGTKPRLGSAPTSINKLVELEMTDVF